MPRRNATEVVSIETAREVRDDALNQVSDLLGTALAAERAAHEETMRENDRLYENVMALGKENEELKSKKGSNEKSTQELIDALKKKYGHIIYSKVEHKVSNETREAAKKYFRV